MTWRNLMSECCATRMPFNRLERLQGQLGMPLPVATQWQLMAAAAEPLRLALAELEPAAARNILNVSFVPGVQLTGSRGRRRINAGPARRTPINAGKRIPHSYHYAKGIGWVRRPG
jgi:hypothetical protein